MNQANQIYVSKQQEILSFRDLATGTINTYISYLSQFLEWAESSFPDVPLDKLSWDAIRSYVKYLQTERRIGNRTINVHIAQLADFWKYVLKLNWDRYEVPFLRFDEKLPAVPSREEMNAIISSINNLKHKAEIALLYSSGIRVSELCHLRCQDIRRAQKAIFIAASKNRSERYAILSDRALTILIQYIRTLYPEATPQDWLFPGSYPDAPISTQSVRNVFSRAISAAGLEGKGFVLHSCRHAFGLHLYEDGTDLMTIKEALGHKSLSSTEVYLTLGIGNGRSVKSPYDA